MIQVLCRLVPTAAGLFLFPGFNFLELLAPFVPPVGYVVHIVQMLMGLAVVTVFAALLCNSAFGRIWAPAGREALA